MKKTLYICYFGIRQPLVQTQVIPYLCELAKGGINVHLLTFEPDLRSDWTAGQIEAKRSELARKGIDWQCLGYHKRPSALATAWDILAGARFVRKLIDREHIDVLHGRVHVATLMGAIARKFATRKPKLIFDIRGFFPEEYTDAGIWPEGGLLYRAAKWVERWLMKEADGFVVLTEKAREILFGMRNAECGMRNADEAVADFNPHSAFRTPQSKRPVEVIPCCVDFAERFPASILSKRDEMREKLGVAGRTVYTHVGALGGLYLTGELADFMAAARDADPSTFALFLTQSDPAGIVSLLRERGFAESDFFAGRVEPNEIPAYLSAADAGLSFVKATYATQSRSPTKIPEYLAAGLAVIANSGVGDVDSLIQTEGIGVLIDSFDRESYIIAINRLAALGDIGDNCRDTAIRRFDVKTVGGARYLRLYERVLQS